MVAVEKPPYRIPSMEEIAATPPNGLTVVSTFSGCGGSCLGFRMAGFRTAYASEFVPAAADTYAANHPGVPLDTRDIREVTGDSIRELSGIAEPDVVEGSPPCASFSTAGKRTEHWGQVKQYSDVEQRVDDLFFEYVRLVGELRPRAFVAENVSGLVKGPAKGYFKQIHEKLEELGYRVEARMLDAQWLGVPQHRERVIFVGIRDDLGVDPVFPKPYPYRYTLRDALGFDFAPHVIARGRRTLHADRPSPTVQTHGNLDTFSELSVPSELPKSCGLDEYAIGAEWEKLKPGESSDRYYNLVRANPDAPSPTVAQMGGRAGAATVTHPSEKRKFTIPELRRISGFPDDFELTGTYAQQWERLGRAVPPPMMRAVARELATLLA